MFNFIFGWRVRLYWRFLLLGGVWGLTVNLAAGFLRAFGVGVEATRW